MRLTKARIKPLSDEVMDEDLRERLRNRASTGYVLNIYRTLAHNPDAMDAFLNWGGYILSKKNSLPARQREIVAFADDAQAALLIVSRAK